MLIWSVLAVAVVGGAFYAIFMPDRAATPVTETAPVEFGDLTVELPATGNIDAVNVIDVGTVVSGRIESLHADFNDRVRAGQLLATVDEDDYRAEFVQAQADLAAAEAHIEADQAALVSARGDETRTQANLERARAVFENASKEWERHRKLDEAGIASRATMERVEAAYTAARADAAAAKAAVEQAGARIKSAAAEIEQARAVREQRAARLALTKRNLDYCRITSPVNGVIISRNVDVGQIVSSRLQAASLFHIAEDLTHMYVYAKMDSSDVSKVRPGLSASFTVNAFPGEVYEGKLIQVRINANAPAPVSRATPVGQLLVPTISAGVTVASTAGSELGASTAAGAAGAGGARGSTGGTSPAGTSQPGPSASSSPQVAVRNTVAVYDALIEFSNPEQRLLPGMTAYVTIPLGSVQQKLKVPNAALRFSPGDETEKKRLLEANGLAADATVVWVVSGERSYRPVRVRPLLTDYVYTAVESDQLQPGMQVATGLTTLRASGR